MKIKNSNLEWFVFYIDFNTHKSKFMNILGYNFAEELAKRDERNREQGVSIGRIGLIAQFIKDYGVEMAKTMLKPSETELKEALNMQ